jgi:predicted MFS family arabinose efflux permease
MTQALVALTAAYVLSQFYRACLAVLAPVLQAEIGADARDLALASGLWFLAFAACQLPVGWALDRIGPQRTASVLFAAGGSGGAAVFAMAEGPAWVMTAMALIGAGCAPVLMSSFYIIARQAPAARFSTLAGIVLGVALIGNVAAAAPLAWTVEAVGWRATLWAIAGLTLAVAGVIFRYVTDPPRLPVTDAGRLRDLWAMRRLWPILAMMAVCYMPVAALRGFWLGPFHAQVFGMDTGQVGQAALVMGVAMIAGTFAMGPLERRLGTRKWLIFATNLLVALATLGLAAFGARDPLTALALFAAIGLLGSSFPLVIAHGRAFVPPALTGRGVTLLNMFGIASVGVAQAATGWLYAAVPGDPFTAVFAAIGLTTLVGCAAYLLSQDRTD